MTDVSLLRAKIDASGYKIRFIANQCGLTYQGFLPKMNGEREFNQNEIAVLRDLLHLTLEEVEKIFFCPKS